MDGLAGTGLSERQERVRAWFDRLAAGDPRWDRHAAAFRRADRDHMRFLVAPGQRVLEIGCGRGDLLAALEPSHGVGVDLSPATIERARARHPGLTFIVGNVEDPTLADRLEGPFDAIVVSDTIGYLEDCQAAFATLRRLCAPHTRLVVAYYSRLWQPLLLAVQRLGLKMPLPAQNWLSTHDTRALLELAGFQPITRDWRQLVPMRLLGLGTLVNRWLAPLPGLRRFCLRNAIVARRAPDPPHELPRPGTAPASGPSVSVIVPCRNERGNIEGAVTRLPRFAPGQEIVFVEGHSSDGTFEECLRVQAAHRDRAITVLRQDGKGKGDAVRKGFAAARGDILIILDADLTVPPEQIPKFYAALANRSGEFVHGTRLVYPMAPQAMRALNFLANRGFALIFSFLLNQRFSDTLCGTKALWRRDYEAIARNRAWFGDFDPFGDFDLLFGAAKLNLKIVEIPIRYDARSYGETQISRFRDGWLLLRMVAFAYRKLKAL